MVEINIIYCQFFMSSEIVYGQQMEFDLCFWLKWN